MLTPHLAEHLRDTIRDLEHDDDINPDDPGLLELKQILQIKIDALEAEHKKSEPEER